MPNAAWAFPCGSRRSNVSSLVNGGVEAEQWPASTSLSCSTSAALGGDVSRRHRSRQRSRASVAPR